MPKKIKKGHKASSAKWLQRHINDPYVKMAKESSYCSRSAFKLAQIDNKYSILRNCKNCIIDLGCYPGGWLQIIKERAVNAVKIIGVDLKITQNTTSNIRPLSKLAIDSKMLGDLGAQDCSINEDSSTKSTQQFAAELELQKGSITTVQGDINDDITIKTIVNLVDKNYVDLILSDMAPSSCGDRYTDYIRIIDLVTASLNLAIKILCKGGNLITKIFHGEKEKEIVNLFKIHFNKVEFYKPPASYTSSPEIYLIGLKKS